MTVYRDNAYKHGIGWSIWHLQWVTKYRRKVFSDPELKKLCCILFEEAAKRYRFRIEEYEVQEDHVHLLVHLRPSMSPAQVIGRIKGYSSNLLFKTSEEKLKKHYWKTKGRRSLWGDGKFFASVGHITLAKAKEYITNQEAHHAKKNILSESPLRSHQAEEARLRRRDPSGLGSVNFSIT
jgi:putative transposase